MATFAELQTRVTRRIIDLPSAIVAEVPSLINTALMQLQTKHNFKVMEAQINAVTVKLTQGLVTPITLLPILLPNLTYTYPAFKSFRGEPFGLRATDGKLIPMQHTESNRVLFGPYGFQNVTNPTIGIPRLVYAQISADDFNTRSFVVSPVPDGNSDYSDGEYRIFIPYWRYLAPLVNAGDHNWFTDDNSGEEYIVKAAAAEGFALNWDFEKQAIMQASAKPDLDDIIKRNKLQYLTGINELAPHWRGVNDQRTRI